MLTQSNIRYVYRKWEVVRVKALNDPLNSDKWLLAFIIWRKCVQKVSIKQYKNINKERKAEAEEYHTRIRRISTFIIFTRLIHDPSFFSKLFRVKEANAECPPKLHLSKGFKRKKLFKISVVGKLSQQPFDLVLTTICTTPKGQNVIKFCLLQVTLNLRSTKLSMCSNRTWIQFT